MFFLKDTTFSLPICPPKLPVSTGNTPTQENKMHSSSDFILKASLKERKLRIPPPLSLSRPALLVFILSNDGIPHCPYTLRALKTLFFFFPTELPPKERHTGGEAVVQNCWYTRKAMVPGSFVWFSGSGMAASVKKTKQKKKPSETPCFSAIYCGFYPLEVKSCYFICERCAFGSKLRELGWFGWLESFASVCHGASVRNRIHTKATGSRFVKTNSFLTTCNKIPMQR